MALLRSVSTLLLAAAVASAHVAPPSTAAQDALRALDTNGSGKVELAELEAFAKSQGMSAQEVREEFVELDLDGDGVLGPEEIGGVLGSASEDAAADDAPRKPATVAVREAPAADPKPVAARRAAAPARPAPPAVVAASPPAAGRVVDLAELEREAQQHAGKALAQIFARKAAMALEAHSGDAKKAAQLEAEAQALRGQTAELKRTAAAQTAQAAREAAAAVYKKADEQVRDLEQRAAAAEREAEQRRDEAKAALDRALRAQAEMAASVRKLRGDERRA